MPSALSIDANWRQLLPKSVLTKPERVTFYRRSRSRVTRRLREDRLVGRTWCGGVGVHEPIQRSFDGPANDAQSAEVLGVSVGELWAFREC